MGFAEDSDFLFEGDFGEFGAGEDLEVEFEGGELGAGVEVVVVAGLERKHGWEWE